MTFKKGGKILCVCANNITQLLTNQSVPKTKFIIPSMAQLMFVCGTHNKQELKWKFLSCLMVCVRLKQLIKTTKTIYIYII